MALFSPMALLTLFASSFCLAIELSLKLLYQAAAMKSQVGSCRSTTDLLDP